METGGDGQRTHEDPVARWVAEGLRDAEIAVRLGVSVGEARTRRSRLTNPGPMPAELALPRALPLPPAPQPATEGATRRRTLARLAPGIVVTVLAVAAGWWVVGAGDSAEGPPQAVSVGSVPIFRGRQPDLLRPGPPMEFPAELSLVLRAGGDSEHGPERLERYYRDSFGNLQRETLMTAPEGTTIGRVVADSEGWELVAALHAADATAFARSRDGGVTWEEIGTRPGYVEPVGLYNGEAVVWRDTGDGLGLFTLLPSGLGFMPPYPGSGMPVALLAKGKLLWRVPGTGQIAETDGAPYLSPEIDANGSYYSWLAPQPTGAGTMVQWDGPSVFTGEAESFVGIVNSGGQVTQQWTGVPGPVAGRTDGATLVAVAPATGPADPRDSMAVLVELQADRWHPIVTGFALVSSPDPDFIASVRRGPFVRISTRAECAPVRVASERAAEAFACLKNGVIMRAPGETRVHNDYTWRQVVGPNGRPGWVDISHLQ